MRPHSQSAPRPPRRPPARGAALLVVIVSTAILTAIAVDLAYSTRVSLLTAANARDELKAEYLARSGAELSRLVLGLQKQLDDSVPKGADAVRVQIWNLVPITSALTEGIFGGAGEGGAPGAFEAKLEDEGRKVNAQMDGLTQGGIAAAQVASFLRLVADSRWDSLFDREDDQGQRVTRTDLAIHLHDWTDPGSVGSALSTSPARPFEDGFGDENQPYYRYEPPYKTKNERFDSLDELFLIAGIDDTFMEAFGKQLTVFPHKDGLINVNTLDPEELLRNASVMADPPLQPKLADPLFGQDLQKKISAERMGGLLTLRPVQFAQILQSFGVQVDSDCLQEGAAAEKNCPFTDRSLVFRIQSTGSAGAVERKVDAVVTFDPRQLGQDPAPAGRMLHWREE